MSADIRNAADWWLAVDEEWDYLLAIIGHFMSFGHPAYEAPGDDTSACTMRDIGEEIEHLRQARDGRLARYFHAAWGMASDAYAWSVPGWGTLCDLCSEEWAIVPEHPEYVAVAIPPAGSVAPHERRDAEALDALDAWLQSDEEAQERSVDYHDLYDVGGEGEG